MVQAGNDRDDEVLASAIVRIRDSDDRVVGAGFLVTPELVITCAHVVHAATEGQGRSGTIHVDFPLLARRGGEAVPTASAEIVSVQPARADDSGDTALLAIRSALPDGAAPAPLATHSGEWDDDLRALGFPEPYDHGVWVSGRLKGRQGAGWKQWESQPGHPRVDAGFSGSPVWSNQLGAVVGMTVATHRGTDSTTAYLVPVDALTRAHPELSAARSSTRPPYRGLEPFLEEHADLFHGRASVVEQLVTAVQTRQLVLVAGPSGSGKSSLVLAGLLPRLRRSATTIVQFRPDPRLEAATQLAAVVVQTLDADLSTADQLSAITALAADLADPGAETFALLARRLIESADNGELLIFADQFEEVVSGQPDTARELLRLILELITAGPAEQRGRAQLRAVLTVRSASLDALLTPANANLLNHGTVLLPPMSRAQLREAVTGPLREDAFEAGLVERVLDDSGTGHGRLPLVEFVLTRLWEESSGNVLLHADYERLGGVSGALVSYAEEVYQHRLTPDQQQSARTLFGELTRAEPDGGFRLRSARVSELDPALRPVLDTLAQYRLVVTGRAIDGAEIVDVTHQALVQEWPRLTDWLIGDREFRAWQEQLRHDVNQWEEHGRDSGGLLRGGALEAAQRWLAARGDDLSTTQRAYIEASSARRSRDARTWRTASALIAVLALVVAALGFQAWRTSVAQGQELRVQAAQLLGEQAQRQVERGDYETALQLALAAWRTDASPPGAYEALLQQELIMGMVERIQPDLWSGDLDAIEATPDGRTFVTIVTTPAGTSELTVWTRDGDTLESWAAPDSDNVIAAALSADGTMLAAADTNGGLRLWNLDSGAGPVIVRSRQAAPLAGLVPLGLAFSPDGTRLLYGYRHTVAELPDRHPAWNFTIWDVDDAEPIREESGREITAIAFGPDADTLVVGNQPSGGEGSVVTEDAVTGDVVHELPADSFLVGRGGAVVTCESGPGLDPVRYRMVDVASGEDIRTIQSRSRFCGTRAVITDATGNYLIDHGTSQQVDDGSYRYDVLALVDLETGTRYMTRLPIGGLRLGLTGGHLVVSGHPAGEPSVIAAVGSSIYELRSAETPIHSVDSTVSADGRFILEIGPEELTLIDRWSGEVVANKLGEHSADADALAGFVATADGRYVTAGAGDPRVLDVYSLPGFDLERQLEVPGHPADLFEEDGVRSFSPCRLSDAQGLIPRFAIHHSELLIPCGPTLSAWTLSTGDEPTHELTLGDPDDTRLADRVFIRPGYPEQVFVVTPRGVELWDIPGGRKLATLETGHIRERTSGPLAGFSETPTRPLLTSDPEGARIAVVTLTGIEVWDVEEQQRLYDGPLLTPQVRHLVGFGPNDTLFVELEIHSQTTVQIWHLPTRELRAAPVLEVDAPAIARLPYHQRYLVLDAELIPYEPRPELPSLVLNPATWFDRLCAIGDRDFTEAELDLLPAGADESRPCAA
jgi:WD40 repeat protein/V8-like Glu-specific endopeptidase/energy-coupling factor transporter ATP-binding protein EcfA2